SVLVRNEAPALAGVQVYRGHLLEQLPKLRPGAASPAAGDHQRAASGPEQLHRGVDRLRIRQEQRRRLRPELLVKLDARRHLAAKGVSGEIDVGRTGLSPL